MTDCMVLTSMNLSALSPWYLQDHSVFTDNESNDLSGLENKDTSASPKSPSSLLIVMKKHTSVTRISLCRHIYHIKYVNIE